MLALVFVINKPLPYFTGNAPDLYLASPMGFPQVSGHYWPGLPSFLHHTPRRFNDITNKKLTQPRQDDYLLAFHAKLELG